MTREDFTEFTRATIDRAVRTAEEKCGRSLSRTLLFQWLGGAVVDSNITEHVVSRVFVAPDRIYPCVDIGVAGTDAEGRTVLVGNVAGHTPQPFGKNWMGSDGPYIVIVGAPLLSGETIPATGVSGTFGISIPGFSARANGG